MSAESSRCSCKTPLFSRELKHSTDHNMHKMKVKICDRLKGINKKATTYGSIHSNSVEIQTRLYRRSIKRAQPTKVLKKQV